MMKPFKSVQGICRSRLTAWTIWVNGQEINAKCFAKAGHKFITTAIFPWFIFMFTLSPVLSAIPLGLDFLPKIWTRKDPSAKLGPPESGKRARQAFRYSASPPFPHRLTHRITHSLTSNTHTNREPNPAVGSNSGGFRLPPSEKIFPEKQNRACTFSRQPHQRPPTWIPWRLSWRRGSAWMEDDPETTIPSATVESTAMVRRAHL